MELPVTAAAGKRLLDREGLGDPLGRERTLEQYNALASRAGLSFASVRLTPSPWAPHLIEYVLS